MRIIRRRSSAGQSTIESLSASPEARAQLWADLVERVTCTVSKEQLERLYHIDGLTFRLVNDYVTYIVRPGFYFLSDNKELVRDCEEWAEDVNLLAIMEEVVRDIFVTGAGNAWVELGYTEDSRDILKLRILNPKTGIDYIRDEQTKAVKLDENFEPLGFVQQKNMLGQKVEWYKDKILVDGKQVWSPRYPGDDGRDRIAHFKLFGLGESMLGQSPLETVFKQALIRLNLEDNVGESGFRSGAVIAYVGEPGKPPVSDAQVEKVVNILKRITVDSIFGFKHNVKVERFPAPDIKDRDSLIRYFADVQCAGMGIPLAKYFSSGMSHRARDLELMSLDFEYRVIALQDRLAEQMREKLFYRMLKARGKVTKLSEVPKVVFRRKTPMMQRQRSSDIARLFRRDILTWDPELEKLLREEFGLPTSFVDKKLAEWREQWKSKHSESSSSDMEEIIEALEELEG
ncbi:MAG: hypothetical protein DRP00_05045 [Candidatus Aenigmatarchaeota archaeon]|nr:MAG: hypothetical protein DRP00_05045 [Candidatus Aenigmarchaeota archaeon]